jgi:hypothetical protein
VRERLVHTNDGLYDLKMKKQIKLNIRTMDMILMKEHVIQLPHVRHFATLLATVEVHANA